MGALQIYIDVDGGGDDKIGLSDSLVTAMPILLLLWS